MKLSWFLISAAIWLVFSGQRAWSQDSNASPAVQSIEVSDGEIQRSLVKSITVHYAQAVNAPVVASDLVLYNITHSLAIPAETQAVTYDTASRTARFTFPTIHGGALPQGNYLARVLAPFDPATVLACVSASPLPPDFAFSFHVRFGDMDGDRDVDFLDASHLWKAWNRPATVAGYNSALDFTFDGKIDQADATIFTWNYFTVFPAAPALHAQLLNDTGISPRDGTTSDASIIGNFIEPAVIAKLQGRFTTGKVDFTDLTGAVDETGAFLIPAALMPSIYGGTLPYAKNTLQLQALDVGGNVVSTAEVSFQFHALNNCPPFFTSTPTPAAAVKISEQPSLADLSRWTVVPYLLNGFGHPNWVLGENNTVARQGVNETASILLSDFESENSRIRGSWRVDTTADDDFMGFVFGFQNDQQYYLFDWKKIDQNGHDGGITGIGAKGMSIKKVKAVKSLTDLWVTSGTANVDVLFHNAIPWEYRTDYEFTLDYFPPNIDITVTKGGTAVATIHVEDSTYTSGRFGFYNFSQEQLLYRGFTRASFPEQTYAYQAKASDPDNDPLTYSIISGPSGLKIDSSTGLLSWAPALTQAGEHPVKIRVSDNRGGAAEQEFTISIVNYDSPPTVSLVATKQIVVPDEASTINVLAKDDVAISNVQLTVNGVVTPLDADGNAVVSLPAIGFLNATATATDSASQMTASSMQIRVRDPNELIPPGPGGPSIPGDGTGDPVNPGGPTGDPSDIPVIHITSPASEASVSYFTTITGSITSPTNSLHSWRVEFAPANQVDLHNLGAQGPEWKLIGSGTQPVIEGALATFDPTMVANNSYVIRAVAFNTNGRGWAEPLILNVAGEAKLGNFKLEFTDLQVPLAGIPITVKRVYDTLEAGNRGEFGYGWKLGLQDGDIRETDTGAGGFFTSNPYKQGTRVYITTPEGKRVGFTFEAVPSAAGLFGPAYKATFKPDPGVYEKLSVPEGEEGFLSVSRSGQVGLYLFGFGWNPDDFILTARDGTQYSYNQEIGLQKAKDLNGNTVTYSRDGVRHSSGVSVAFIRDTKGRITEIRDPDGKSIKYGYDAPGDLRTVTDRMDLVTSFDYRATPAHYLDKITDPLGRQAVRTEYGPDGRIKAVIDALGNRTEQDFDPANFTGTRTDSRGNVTKLVYDARANLLEERKPEGGVTKYEYTDPVNPDKQTAKIDPRGNRWATTYDARGNKLTETDPLGTVTEYTYNSLNKILSLTRKNSAGVVLTTESAEYNAKGNLTRLTDCAGNTRDFVYDDSGRILRSTDFEGNLTQYDYTNACPCGSPSKIIYADGKTKLFEYNRFGQIVQVTDETGAITRTRYNAKGLKISETDHDGKATLFEYDDADNQIKRTDRLGRVTKFKYDAKNNLVQEIKILTDDGNDTNDVILNYEYDGDRRLTALVDPVGNRTEFGFDRDGRLVSRKDAVGAITRVTYDVSGNTETITNRNGQKRSFLYDARNLPVAERWHDELGSIIRTIISTLDELGRRTGLNDPDSAYSYKFDVCSRITQVSNQGTPNAPLVILNYGYDKDGHLNSVTDNAGVSVQTSFDARGRSKIFTWSGGGIAPASVDLNRNGRGQVTSLKRFSDASLTKLIGSTTMDQIAPQGWVKQIQHRGADGNLYNAESNFTYSYDFEGQVVGQSSQGNTTAYTYDPTGQLLTAQHSSAAYPDEFYNYNKAGSRLSSHLHAAYTVGAANRLQSDGIYNYGYDAEGNLVTKTEIATGKVTTLSYDHRGRVTSIVERASAGGAITEQQSYVFDALDRRISLIVNGAVTHIAYHQENAWADYSAAGVATARYLFADRIDGNLAKWTTDRDTEWYLTDKIGSVRGLVSSSGVFSSNVSYDSFGILLDSRNAFAPDRYGFSGRELISNGLISYRSRLHDPKIGSFLAEDQIDFRGGDWNLRRYVGNNPIRFADPFGHEGIEYALIVRAIAFEVLADVTCSLINNKQNDPGYADTVVSKGALLGVLTAVTFFKVEQALATILVPSIVAPAQIIICIAL